MQGKLIAVAYTLRTYWNRFSLGEKNRCISVRLVSVEVKEFKFENFDNSHNSFLWPEFFIDFLRERWIPCQASFTFSPGDSTLQYERCVHLCNNFPCIITLGVILDFLFYWNYGVSRFLYSCMFFRNWFSGSGEPEILLLNFAMLAI